MSEKKTPEQWEAQYGLEVRDTDGWRRDNTPWEQPITLPDFWRRYAGSTARLVAGEQFDRLVADVRAARREDAQEGEAPTKTTGRHVHIENRNPEGKKILSGGRVPVDGEDISNYVMAVDIHMDGKSLPTARLEMVGLDVDIEAVEAEPEDAIPGELVAAFDPIMCTPCVIEQHAGIRADINPAYVVAGGDSICREHIQINAAPAPAPGARTASGIIIPGANGSGG